MTCKCSLSLNSFSAFLRFGRCEKFGIFREFLMRQSKRLYSSREQAVSKDGDRERSVVSRNSSASIQLPRYHNLILLLANLPAYSTSYRRIEWKSFQARKRVSLLRANKKLCIIVDVSILQYNFLILFVKCVETLNFLTLDEFEEKILKMLYIKINYCKLIIERFM